ncbi:MAG: hypothetical protein M1818_003057 [Claussenomyces sp. TS43310]|nr:MAG: hypothetical protein M1818_003057 [Claussenomyces sp. TS43310]
MFLLNPLSLVLALASGSFAFPTFAGSDEALPKSSIAEKLAGPPAGWISDDSTQVDKDVSMIKLRIHLVQQNMDKFHDMATNIATPGHELYGSHLAQHVIDEMIAPKDQSRELVMEWLDREGLSNQATVSARSDAVIVQASVHQIEELLKAEYSGFVREATGDRVLRTLEYSLPDSLQGHVDMVQPTTFFGLKPMRSTISKVTPADKFKINTEAVSDVSGCDGGTIDPECLSNLYSFASSTSTQSKGLMGIAGFLEQYASTSDLSTFLSNYAVYNNADLSYKCTTVNGGSCPSNGDGTEANLDVQYARAITKEIPNTFYSVGGSPPIVGGGTNDNEPYLEFLDYLLGLSSSSLPNTISISYGDDEATVPLDYADNVCNLFSQLGARGVSILVASGDSGVGTTCKTGSKKTFTTSFPASCPWVTVVGGTTSTGPEQAWESSGGGFSTVFGRPSYQNTAVTNWLNTDTTHSGVKSYFNSSGRAYPDVAAQSTSFIIVVDGEENYVDGTSCASPTFASIVQLLNSQRVAAGKTGLGFLNPWLYSNATSGLTDITSGSNTGCSGVISNAGFSAVSGWDPATGLGTPIFSKLSTIAGST